MLDQILQPLALPHLQKFAAKLNGGGLSAPKISIGAFVLGLTGCFCAGMQLYIPALLFLLCGRAGAGLAATDLTTMSHKHRYLATLADFIVFGAFVFLFSLGVAGTSMAAAFAIFSILVMGLAYSGAIVPEDGIVGETEMILFMTICCLLPAAFPAACIFFGLLCWVTAALRAFKAAQA